MFNICEVFYSLPTCSCSGTRVFAEVDEMETEDGTKIQPVSVTFPEGNTVCAQDHNKVQFYSQDNKSLILAKTNRNNKTRGNYDSYFYLSRGQIMKPLCGQMINCFVSSVIDTVEKYLFCPLKALLFSFFFFVFLCAFSHQQETKVTSLVCSVSFCSDVPLSMWTTITFADHMSNR